MAPSSAGLAVHDTGEGPAVLFLHAFPLDATQWDHQVAALSGSRRCIRPDIWGCGRSAAPPGDVSSLDEFAAAILSELDARDVRKFAVVGLSMGGYAALSLLQPARDRISALVLCNTRATADSDSARGDRLAVAERAEREQSVEFLVEANVERLLGPRARREPHITDPLRGRIHRCTPAGIAFAQRAMAARPDRTGLLAGIAAPALVVAGAHDAVIQAAETESLAAAIPGARRETIDCGHLSNLEEPETFSQLLTEFLESAHA